MKTRWQRLTLALLMLAGIAWLVWLATRPRPAPLPVAEGAAASAAVTGAAGNGNGNGNTATAAAAATAAANPAGTSRDRLHYAADAPQLAMLRAEVVAASPLPLAGPLSARIAYDEDVTARIGTSMSGRVVALKASAGDRVRPGQVLALIDSPDVGTAQADLAKAVADEQKKRLVRERAQDLESGGAIASRDLEAAVADHAQAEAETARARQRLANLNPGGLPLQGQRVALVSPLAGVVSERNATPALEVGPGLAAPLFVVTDPRRLWLMIDLPERLAGQVRLGSAVAVTADASPDARFRATVVQLGQVVDANTRRVVVRARLEDSGGRLLPEMFVRASLLQAGGSGVELPNSAVVNRGVHDFVFVQTAPGDFERRGVRLASRGADSSFVGDGLRGGERVVTSGALLLDAEMSAQTGDSP